MNTQAMIQHPNLLDEEKRVYRAKCREMMQREINFRIIEEAQRAAISGGSNTYSGEAGLLWRSVYQTKVDELVAMRARITEKAKAELATRTEKQKRNKANREARAEANRTSQRAKERGK